ncbi:MAG TPA: saccharopine dehydrogenase NADP-binding domain-containing protein [Dermatophilaceae bacterium]|nr:saccharopine dehydrogenase NADP-binding domain-containing protein [Dermatophilaceae bacterium]
MPGDRPHDIVIYGATGFVGRLLAGYLAEHAPEDLRLALAGRSRERLAAVRAELAELAPRAAAWPVLVADAADDAGLRDLAASARVVVTTVGPYQRYGLPLARACAEQGTHCADLTGETLFVRQVIDTCDEAARTSGARIVTACGYDSIPSDLGVLMLHERAVADGAGDLLDTTLVARAKGGASGGTVDSSRAQLEALTAHPALTKVLFDPYALSPAREAEPSLPGQRDVRSVFFDHESGQWVGPFVMGMFNTRIVRRSNALLGHAYGKAFRYREAAAFGRGARGRRRAVLMTAGLGLGLAAMANPLTRPLANWLMPSPGEGPSEEARRAGWFRMEIRTHTSSGRRYLAVVAAQGDPGYAATSVMLGESALCLAGDPSSLPLAAGVLTPATALGTALVERLRARGFTMTVEELAS